MTTKLKTLAITAGLFVLSGVAAQAAVYSQNFDSFANGINSFGDGSILTSTSGVPASVQTQALELTNVNNGSTQNTFNMPAVAGSSLGFTATFKLTLIDTAGGNPPADGLAFSYGNFGINSNFGEEGPGATSISWIVDTWDNGVGDRGLRSKINGVNDYVQTMVPLADGGNFTTDVTLAWNPVDGMSMTIPALGGAIFTNRPTPGFTPSDTFTFAFGARTGGATETVRLDNIVITTTPVVPISRPNLAISEMVIDNTKYEDEHCQTPGWVELYNGTANAISLNGWSLTDDPAVPAKWVFPNGRTVPAYGYQIVYFGYGSPLPINPDTRLHASFKPFKTGGFLGLYQGATQVDAVNPYPAQFENVAYGHLGQPWTLGFLQTTTPGSQNTGLQMAQGPVDEEVVWPRDGGFFTNNFTVTLPAPVTPGGIIRYTLDNTIPSPTSPQYTAPLNVSARTNIRARVFAPDRLPGPVTSRSFLKLDSSITNYRGTGQAFKSNLPVIVLDSFGTNIDGLRSYAFTYGVVLAPDAANGNMTSVTDTAPVDFQGRGGTHLRGETSAGMPQKPYAWETWDNEGNDKDVSILGLPSDSDWVLYAPANDKTLLRNYIVYNTMFDANGQGSAMRTRLVEVFFNQPSDANTNISWSDYRGVYVLVEKIKRGKDRVDIEKLEACDTAPSLISGGYIFKKDKASTDPDFTTTNGQLLQLLEPETTVGSTQWTWLRDHMNSFESTLYGANFADPVNGFRAFIDERSFQDNELWVEMFKQIDGYRLSTYFYKDRGQKIKSAPVWDYNLSAGNADYLAGYNYRGWYRDAGISQGQSGNTDFQYYWRLRQDPKYVLTLWDRFWQLRKSLFATPALMARIDQALTVLTNGNPGVNITNGTGTWPNSTPSAEVPAARHHSRWQALGIYDWPNAPGYGNRTKFTSTTDATDYTTHTTTPYNPDAFPVMSESDHLKTWMTNRLSWMDNGYLTGNTILRPPSFSQEGGNVAAGFALRINAYTGTAPAASNYNLGGTLIYATGPIYYTTNGNDPSAPGALQYSSTIPITGPVTIKARQFNTATSSWTPMTTGTFVVATVPASASNLVVSEIMYHPNDPVTAEINAGYNNPNMFEYVEVQNISTSNVDLSGVSFSDAFSFTWPSVDPALRTLAPGERAVLVGHLAAFNMRYAPAGVKIAGVFDGNLSNSGEHILITGTAGVIKDFTFDDEAPWPMEPDTGGYSLVLNNPGSNPDHNAARNWRSSMQVNGTPGTAPGASGPTGSGAVALADTDGDGISDVVEYATGTFGVGGAAARLPVTAMETEIVAPATTPATYLYYRYVRDRSADGFSLEPEISTALTGWQPLSSLFTFVGQTNNADGTATLSWRSTQPASTLPGRFFLQLRAGISAP